MWGGVGWGGVLDVWMACEGVVCMPQLINASMR